MMVLQRTCLRCIRRTVSRQSIFKAVLAVCIVSFPVLVVYGLLLAKDAKFWPDLSIVQIQSRTFAKNYYHDYEESADQFINRLKGIVSREWKADRKMTRKFRDDLRIVLSEIGQIDNFLLTKNNTSRGMRMPCYMHGWSHEVSTALWKCLPQESVFKRGQFKRCSIVGSSSILKGSRCGKTIDEAQFVVRFNTAPVRDFEADVGTKTHFTTLNPSFVEKKLNGLETQADRSRLLEILRQFSGNYLWLPIFAVFDNVAFLTKIGEITNGIVRPIYGHPNHYLSASTLWRSICKETLWPSTGLYSILSFFDVCDQIDVFGFWPLPTFINGSSAPYHYHDTVKAMRSTHDFDSELKFLGHMHELGVIQMHFGSCP